MGWLCHRAGSINCGLTTEGYSHPNNLTKPPEATAEDSNSIRDVVEVVADIYRDNPGKTQAIFFDVGVNPTKYNPDFSFRNDLKKQLVKEGIPEDKIADFFEVKGAAHARLEARLRSGEKLVGIGSTEKLGTGTNIQPYLVACHDLDAPWRPSDVNQRNRRALRQGNKNSDIGIYRYVTEGSFDAFNWQLLDSKGNFIHQFMRPDGLPPRAIADNDNEEISASTIMALASGDPTIFKRQQLQNDVEILEIMEKRHNRDKSRAEMIADEFREKLAAFDDREIAIRADSQTARNLANPVGRERPALVIDGTVSRKNDEIGYKFYDVMKARQQEQESMTFGDSLPEKHVGMALSGCIDVRRWLFLFHAKY